MPTVVEENFKVWAGPVLHQHGLGPLRVECDLGRLGADQPHKLGGILVLLPVAGGQVVVGVGGLGAETRMGGAVVGGVSPGLITLRRLEGAKYFHLGGRNRVKTIEQ